SADSGTRLAGFFFSPHYDHGCNEDDSTAARAGHASAPAACASQQSGPGSPAAADVGPIAGGCRLGRVAMAPRVAAIGITNGKKRRACTTPLGQGSRRRDGAVADTQS